MNQVPATLDPHRHFSLDYLAENLDASCVVLQYPTRGERLSDRLRRALERTRDSLVLDCNRLTQLEPAAAQRLADTLHEYRDRIRILVPSTLMHPGVAAALAVFMLHQAPYPG